MCMVYLCELSKFCGETDASRTLGKSSTQRNNRTYLTMVERLGKLSCTSIYVYTYIVYIYVYMYIIHMCRCFWCVWVRKYMRTKSRFAIGHTNGSSLTFHSSLSNSLALFILEYRLYVKCWEVGMNKKRIQNSLETSLINLLNFFLIVIKIEIVQKYK